MILYRYRGQAADITSGLQSPGGQQFTGAFHARLVAVVADWAHYDDYQMSAACIAIIFAHAMILSPGTFLSKVVIVFGRLVTF